MHSPENTGYLRGKRAWATPGVDHICMAATLDAVGIGILDGALLQQGAEYRARQAIAGRLLFFSASNPNAPADSPMNQSRLSRAIEDCGLVVSAKCEEGEAWLTARAALEQEASLPMFVQIATGSPPESTRLLEMGAIPWPEPIDPDHVGKQLAQLAVPLAESGRGNPGVNYSTA